jgi:hypothetical protein
VVVISVSLSTFSGGDRTDRTPRVVSVVSALHKPVASAAVIAMMLAWALPAAAKNYYVDGQTGNDTYQGTSTDPFRSFKHATSVLAPGDKLIVASGRYTEPLIVSKSGTAQQPISIVGNGRPLIEAKGIAIRISGSYVEISGFEAHGLGQEGSAIGVGKRNHHVRIADNIARDSGCAGIGSIQTDYLIVENNRVFGNSRRSPWQCSGISIYQAINFDHAEGTHNIIRRNIVYNNMNIVVDNKITNDNSGGKTTDGNGIIVDDTRHTQGGLTDPAYDGLTLIENNVVFDNGGRGIQIFKSDHVFVRNNTSYHNVKDPNIESRYSQAEFMAVYASDVRFINNISAPRDNTVFGFMDVYTDGNDIWNFNLIEDGMLLEGGSRKGWGHHNIFETGGVDFVAPSVDPQTANFHLRQGSRAIGAGSLSDAPSEDFLGAARPRFGPVDLGAFQTSVVGN